MDWPQAKYITYTKFIDKHQTPKLVGYIQFSAPIKKDMLYTINSNIRWTEQRFSNSACMRYIEKINAEERGQLTTLGTHWPIKIYTQPPPSPQEQMPEPVESELKKKPPTLLKKPRTYQQQPLHSAWQNQGMWGQQTL